MGYRWKGLQRALLAQVPCLLRLRAQTGEWISSGLTAGVGPKSDRGPGGEDTAASGTGTAEGLGLPSGYRKCHFWRV